MNIGNDPDQERRVGNVMTTQTNTNDDKAKAEMDTQTRDEARLAARRWAQVLTNEALAHRLIVMAETPRAYSREERYGMIYEASQRLNTAHQNEITSRHIGT